MRRYSGGHLAPHPIPTQRRWAMDGYRGDHITPGHTTLKLGGDGVEVVYPRFFVHALSWFDI